MFVRSTLMMSLMLLAAPFTSAQTKAAPLTAEQLEAIWKDLIQHDDDGTKKARAGMREMVASPQVAAAFLKDRLKPVPVADIKRIEQCIADLDSGDFQTRDKASKALEAFGEQAGPAMRKKLKDKTSLEVQQRLDMLLQKIGDQPLTADELRAVRAIETLEGIGTTDAQAILQSLAKGGEGAMLTEQAKRSLERLARRSGGK